MHSPLRHLILIIAILPASIAAFAQKLPNGASHYEENEWRLFTSRNSSLPTDTIAAIGFDAAGSAWVGMAPGIARFHDARWDFFDGSLNYDYPSNVQSIMVDGEGIMRVGTLNGVYRYDGVGWSTFNEPEIRGKAVTDILIDRRGGYWYSVIGPVPSIWNFDGTYWNPYNRSNSPIPVNTFPALGIDSSGAVWVGTTGGIVSFDGAVWTSYQYWEVGYAATAATTAIAVDRNGKVFIGVKGWGLTEFDGTNWRSYSVDSSTLQSNYISALAVDPRNRLWVGFGFNDPIGVAMYDGANWRYFSSENSPLPYGSIYDFAFDSLGHTWIATDGGVVVYREGGVKVSGVEPDGGDLKSVTVAVHPNRVTESATIEIDLSGASSPHIPTEVTIVDIMGRTVGTLLHEELRRGRHLVRWDAAGLPSGIYFCTLRTGAMMRAVRVVVGGE